MDYAAAAPPSLLSRPLLSDDDEEKKFDAEDEEVLSSAALHVLGPASHHQEQAKDKDQDENDDDDDGDQDPSQQQAPPPAFTVRSEIGEMASLALPLAISFFCRMGMASTDSAFVGHIHDGGHSTETYLAAAVLSDMVINVLMVPPLAFNQVLNALVGQAMGSSNPRMAGIWLQQSMAWLSLSMVPCLAGCFYVEPILLAMDFPPDVAAVAGTYARYNVVWPIPNGLYQCMRFYFQAQGLPKPAMVNNMVFLFVNAALNWVLVFGGPLRYLPAGSWGHWTGWGFVGAAISLSISRTAQSVAYFLYMFVHKRHHVPTWPQGGLRSWRRHHTKSRTVEFLKQSVPNMGTLLFQQCASQATTVLIGRLGERSIAASSALSTVTLPWSGTLSATTWTVSSVRVGYHLGRGDAKAARQSAWIVLNFLTLVSITMTTIVLPLKNRVLSIATDDADVLSLGAGLIPAVLVGTYLNLLVGNVTSGVFGGMGRPLIATVLSFGLELPLSIGGVALLILRYRADLLAVTWFQAIAGGVEAVLVIGILLATDWNRCADDARARQESSPAAAGTVHVTGTAEEEEEEGDRNDGGEGGDEETANLLPWPASE